MPTAAVKRLYTQTTPDPIIEPTQPNTIVIIHPGSRYLRIGKASDAFPVTIPHCIAWRKKNNKEPFDSQPLFMRQECVHSESRKQQKEGLKLAEEALLTRQNSSGEYRQSTSYKQLYSFNSSVRPDRTGVVCPQKWTNTDKRPPFLIGEEALYVHSSDKYVLHWPMRRGQLNIHSGPGGTLSSIFSDLEEIWSTAIQTRLEIPLKDLMLYRVILLVPDIFTHQHVKELTSLLLVKLGFGAIIVFQESVCATFGAGVSCACVVDVGDQKTSVCCVEDGISIKNTRITMEYGGSDVTRSLKWLLERIGFNPRDIDMKNNVDGFLFEDIKEIMCHMDQDKDGLFDQHIQIRRPQQNIVKYSIKVGDEAVLAPMSLFFPDLFNGLQGSQWTRVQSRYTGDPADPHDEFFLRQTQSKQEQAARQNAAKKKENPEMSREDSEANLAQLDESQLGQSQIDDDSNDATDVTLQQTDTKVTRRFEEELEEDVEPIPQLMGVDQAILQSIDRLSLDEIKKKMYSCIVVVGGGMLFREAQQSLQYRVWVGMPPQYRLMLETMDVITRPKDMDPQLTCWKGAAVLACLDTCQELWIKQKEWNQFDVRLLRERASFDW